MRALSLWQPWASAIACGWKKVETRSWSTNYRGPLAIHAAKKWDADLRALETEFAEELGVPFPETLPFGAVICVVDLVDCVEMTEEWIADLTFLERELGNYAPERYGWVLENPRVLEEPYPMTGQRRTWRLDVGVINSINLLAGIPIPRLSEFKSLGGE